MVDWFRNTEWNEEIEAAFEDRIGKARNKAQYLNIQAYTLLATHPEVAARLARRAFECADSSQTARAGLYLGTALALVGDLEGAIAALELAIEAEEREPAFSTGAYLDHALLVALAKRTDLYDLALERMVGERRLPLEDQPLSALIAQALIGSERGEAVGEIANQALDALKGSDTETPLLSGLSVANIKKRLVATVSSGRS